MPKRRAVNADEPNKQSPKRKTRRLKENHKTDEPEVNMVNEKRTTSKALMKQSKNQEANVADGLFDFTHDPDIEKIRQLTSRMEESKGLEPRGDRLIGAHCSISGGLHNAVVECCQMGGHAFALFLRNQRSWNSKALDDQTAAKFRAAVAASYLRAEAILPHGIYLMNCGSPRDEIYAKSRDSFVDDMKRCQKLGVRLFNFHPGSHLGQISVDECCRRIADCINLALEQTEGVTAVLENMSRQGNTVGGHFDELRKIIDLVADKSRVGVCLDTCHLFAAGYDIRTPAAWNQTIHQFDHIVGLPFLKAIHLNDSKSELGSHLDRHENIGKGKLKKACFKMLMADDRLKGLPIILETPNYQLYEKEIQLLYSMLD